MPSMYRSFTENEEHNRDAWIHVRIENDCDGCEVLYYADGEGWRPAEQCPVHGINPEPWWSELNRELDARWPGTWGPQAQGVGRTDGYGGALMEGGF